MDQNMMGMPGSMMQPSSFMGAPPINPITQFNNLYKTQICKHFMQSKYCHVGAKCHFAHGEHELRKPEDVSNCFIFKHSLFLYISLLLTYFLIAFTHRINNEDDEHSI